MQSHPNRLTIDEGVEYLERSYGLVLSREALERICEGGWSPCSRESDGEWMLDPARIDRSADRVRVLALQEEMEYVEREATQDVMEEPPTGAEAGEGI